MNIVLQRNRVLELLYSLSPDQTPLFGTMSPQHMVEHLAFVVKFSNGKLPQQLYYRQEKANKFKQYTIYSENELVPGFKAPMLSDELPPLEHNSLAEAIEALKEELKAFDVHFQQDPDSRPVSPTLGPLLYEEWVIFHNKHFKHHLKQFGLA